MWKKNCIDEYYKTLKNQAYLSFTRKNSKISFRMGFLSKLALAVLVTGYCGTSVYGHHSEAVEIDLFDEVNRKLNTSMTTNSCDLPTPISSSFRRAPKDNKAAVCRHPIGRYVCDTVQQSFPPGSYWEEEPSLQKKRFSDESLRKRVFSFTSKFFDNFVNNIEAQNRCCQNPVIADLSDAQSNQARERCKNRFKKTKLILLKNLGPNVDIGRYSEAKNSVLVSEAMLLNCKNEQCIEGLLYHELGHACQLSQKVPGSSPLANDECKSANENEGAASDIKYLVGDRVKNCIVGRFKKLKNALPDQNICWEQWLGEAFADLVFLHYRKDQAHLASDCYSSPNWNHGSFAVAVSCGLIVPEIREAVCGK